MYIALMGSESDAQIIHLASAIKNAGHAPVITNTHHFGTHWHICYDPDYHDGFLTFAEHYGIPKNRIALSSIDAAYWHQYLPPMKTGNDDPSFEGWREQELASSLMPWFTYESIQWVNNIEAVRAHQSKPIQLKQACALGAKIPFTYVGNSTEMAYQFCDNIPEVIYKPVKGGRTAKFVKKSFNLRKDVHALLQNYPVTFQAYIDGTNVRSYVLGNEVISVQIDTDALDFRDDTSASPVLTIVPPHIKTLAVKLCSSLGMKWCAIDWRREHTGEYYFLEANPCPYFLYVEQLTGVDITGRLLNLMGIKN